MASYAKLQLMASGHAEEEAILQSHKSAIALFWAGCALRVARDKKKEERHGAWTEWKRDHSLRDTSVNDAIRLFDNAETVDALVGLGVTEAKVKFVYPHKVRDGDEGDTGDEDSLGDTEITVADAESHNTVKSVGQGKTTAKKTLKDIKKGKKTKPESIPKPDAKEPDTEDAVGEGDPISEDDVWEEPEEEPDHVDAPRSEQTLLLDVANTLTQSLMDLLRVMDKLDWSQEDNAMWTEASETLKERTDAFATKVQKAFTKVPRKRKPSKPKPTPKDITIRKLKTEYGRCALQVLHEYLKELPRDEGAMRSYRITKPLPSKEEFIELQRKRYTSTVVDLTDDAFGAFSDLAGEIGDWYDNLPEGFQSGDKGCVLEEARDTLDGLSQPDVPESIGESQVFYLPLEDTSSRASRRDDAVGRLQVVVESLEGTEDAETKMFIDELENAISEAEGVDFPGMY